MESVNRLFNSLKLADDEIPFPLGSSGKLLNTAQDKGNADSGLFSLPPERGSGQRPVIPHYPEGGHK